MNDRNPVTWDITCCLPACAAAGSWHQKEPIWKSNTGTWHGMGCRSHSQQAKADSSTPTPNQGRSLLEIVIWAEWTDAILSDQLDSSLKKGWILSYTSTFRSCLCLPLLHCSQRVHFCSKLVLILLLRNRYSQSLVADDTNWTHCGLGFIIYISLPILFFLTYHPFSLCLRVQKLWCS